MIIIPSQSATPSIIGWRKERGRWLAKFFVCGQVHRATDHNNACVVSLDMNVEISCFRPLGWVLSVTQNGIPLPVTPCTRETLLHTVKSRSEAEHTTLAPAHQASLYCCLVLGVSPRLSIMYPHLCLRLLVLLRLLRDSSLLRLPGLSSPQEN